MYEDEGVEGVGVPGSQAEAPGGTGPDAATCALVTRWCDKVVKAKEHWKPDFDRMRKCMELAEHGALKSVAESGDLYVVPILKRHTNMAVASLYAKNPQTQVVPREKMFHRLWDGTSKQIATLAEAARMGDMAAAEQLAAIQDEIQRVQNYRRMLKGTAKTLTLLLGYVFDEMPFNYKRQVKQAVRRAKTTVVAYCKIGYEREMGLAPDDSRRLSDVRAKLAARERLSEDVAAGDVGEDDPEMAELRNIETDLARRQDFVIKQGVTIDFPKSTEVIIDPRCRDLATLIGAGWLAHELARTVEEVRDEFGVDLSTAKVVTDKAGGKIDCDDVKLTLYEVQDKRLQQVFVICEGHDDWVVPPHEREYVVEGFFNIEPLVFNEVESEKGLFPPSEIWDARHSQLEFNRSREALRQHRVAAKPWWVVLAGMLETKERDRVANHDAHEVVEIRSVSPDRPIDSQIMAGPTAPIDPNLYETSSIYDDMGRAVGVSEAYLGQPGGSSTATGESIAEGGRLTAQGSNVDDLDTWLSAISKKAGHILLEQMDAETVREIVGPGAVWPDTPLTRAEITADLQLRTKAGSSGRPNRAARLKDLERAFPAMSQIPGINPQVFADEYLQILEIDTEEAIAEGLPSIVAQNSTPPATNVGGAPAAQGAAGGARPVAVESAAPDGRPPAAPTPGELDMSAGGQ